MNYFYLDDENREIGPVPVEVLRALHKAGALTDATLARPQSGGPLAPLSSVIGHTPASTIRMPGLDIAILRKYSWAAYFVALICFFLPFMEVSFQQQTVTTVTGRVLATGDEIVAPDSNSGKMVPQNQKPEPSASWAFGLTVIALLLSFSRQPTIRLLCGLGGAGGVIALLILKLSLEKQITDQGQGVLELRMGLGFWLAIVCLVAGAVMQFKFVKEEPAGIGPREGVESKVSKRFVVILAICLLAILIGLWVLSMLVAVWFAHNVPPGLLK